MPASPLPWVAATAAALGGLAALVAGLPAGALLAWVGAAGLAARLARERRPGEAPRARRRGAAFGLAAAGGAAALLAGGPAGLAAGALGAQALLAWAGREPAREARHLSRYVFPALGHATALVGSVLLLLEGRLGAGAGLALACGFSMLALHAFWQRRLAGGEEATAAWELPLLLALLAGMGSMTLVQLGAGGSLPLAAPWSPVAKRLAVGAAIAALAILARPPPAPRALQRRRGILARCMAHGAAGIAVVNVLFLTFSFVAGWSLTIVLGVLLAWQALAVSMEYRTIRHAERQRRRPRCAWRSPELDEPVTVVIAACDEADVLPRTLEHNVALEAPLRFLLVPATKSSDRTVEVAHALAARHPHRVRVVEGTTGSKAEDLNLCWRHVRTDKVLILDADETIDLDSLARGLDVLRRHPEVGVVQGRKVSRDPQGGFLARFVSAERRYSTRMDHPMHADEFGSAHFAGSAALLRRDVPVAVGGWTPRTLTEDIEFTLRLHTLTCWRIAYEPRMVVRESNPRDLGELLGQRTRWARGWTECFLDHFLPVLRAQEHLGRKRALGLAWLLLTPVSALWTTLLPAMLVLRVLGMNLLPAIVLVPIAFVVLPARLLAYAYAALRDPVIPLRGGPLRLLELGLHAYGWIFLGWFIQLHALYLELSNAPRAWYVTRKETGSFGARPAAPPAEPPILAPRP